MSGGIQKMWILNVGDIKPAEYQVELFLDMAWNLEAVKQQGVAAHQRHFLEREFGKNRADRLQPVMQEAYRLAYIRKPEFMGNTRTEEKDPKFKVISDLPWSSRKSMNVWQHTDNCQIRWSRNGMHFLHRKKKLIFSW